jgi:3-oxoacyl-[acyl-carrier-protein] synthase II
MRPFDQRRVVVTGLGVVSSIGIGPAEFTAGLLAGRSGVSPITAFDTTGYAHAHGCQVLGFDPKEWIRRVPVDEIGRASQFSAAAARMAMHDAGLTEADLQAAHAARSRSAAPTANPPTLTT